MKIFTCSAAGKGINYELLTMTASEGNPESFDPARNLPLHPSAIRGGFSRQEMSGIPSKKIDNTLQMKSCGKSKKLVSDWFNSDHKKYR